MQRDPAQRALIVNADDFGLSPGVNRAIVEAHASGIVTSATIMANMPAFDEAVALAKAYPTLGVGLHFNITQGRPVAAPAAVSSMLNGNGEFLGTSTALALRAWQGGLNLEHVAVELRAQLEKVLGHGLQLTHADSHKHAHALPRIFAAMTKILPEYGIHAIRLPRESFNARFAFQHTKVFKQSLTAIALSQFGKVNARQLSGMQAPQSLLGIAQTGFWSFEWLRDCFTHFPSGVTELMCHPGYDDLQTVATRLRATRETELRWLTDASVKALIQEQGIQLIHFGELEETQ